MILMHGITMNQQIRLNNLSLESKENLYRQEKEELVYRNNQYRILNFKLLLLEMMKNKNLKFNNNNINNKIYSNNNNNNKFNLKS